MRRPPPAVPFSRFAALAMLAALALVCGCGSPPQVGPENFRLIDGLRTAISTRRADWLESTARLIVERHDAGELSDEQFAALDAIVVQARSGQWQDAQAEITRLAKAQKPTAEEVARSKARRKTPAKSKS